jgi:isopentenyl-diphosphate delta-isomerase
MVTDGKPVPMAERTTVVLVDESGQELGTAAKQDAHNPPGRLHLAFSVFLFTPGRRQLLLQQRARSKYHFPGIWANTCCSHPAPGEDLIESARLRLSEELGVAPEDGLVDVGTFVYRAVDPVSGLVEHELDHVVVGTLAGSEGIVRPDPAEVEAVRWVAPADVLGHGPAEGFAPWFATALATALG